MADRTLTTTKARILSLLTRIPQGVTRAGLHAVTGDTDLIHAAMDELVAEGIVTERVITAVRGKPRREYILTENIVRLGLDRMEPAQVPQSAVLPGAKAIVEHIVTTYPGTSRSELWNKAVVTKSWVSHALTELIKEGKIVELMEEDSRGGLIRRYLPSTANDNNHAEREPILAGQGRATG